MDRCTVCRPVVLTEIIHHIRIQNGELKARVIIRFPFQRMIRDKSALNNFRKLGTAEHHVMESAAVIESVITDFGDIVRQICALQICTAGEPVSEALDGHVCRFVKRGLKDF